MLVPRGRVELPRPFSRPTGSGPAAFAITPSRDVWCRREDSNLQTSSLKRRALCQLSYAGRDRACCRRRKTSELPRRDSNTRPPGLRQALYPITLDCRPGTCCSWRMELDSNQRRTLGVPCDLANRRHKPLGHPSFHWGRGGDLHPCRLHGTQASWLLNDRDADGAPPRSRTWSGRFRRAA